MRLIGIPRQPSHRRETRSTRIGLAELEKASEAHHAHERRRPIADLPHEPAIEMPVAQADFIRDLGHAHVPALERTGGAKDLTVEHERVSSEVLPQRANEDAAPS